MGITVVVLRCEHRGNPTGYQDVDRWPDELGGESDELIWIPPCVSHIEDKTPSLHVGQFAQCLPKDFHVGIGWRTDPEDADPPNPIGLLR